MKLRIIAIFAFSTTLVFAVGPKIPCVLTFTPSPSPDVTGYWFYWSQGSTTNWTDTQRWAIASSSASTGTDLRIIGLPKGNYTACMTATNAVGAESDPTTSLYWQFSNPNGPNNPQIR